MTATLPPAYPSYRCEADLWTNWTGAENECPNEATHMESWFDEEGVEVWLCDDHATT